MTQAAKFSGFIQMLHSFIEGREGSRGTIFVRQIEGEFALLGFDDDEDFSDLQDALATYQGHEADIQLLKKEVSYVLRLLAAREAGPIQPTTANDLHTD